jgi:hypothetical protein
LRYTREKLVFSLVHPKRNKRNGKKLDGLERKCRGSEGKKSE